MHVIDSDGATIDNKFTEGDASLSIPATVVSAAIANAWQEEIANVIRELSIPLLTSSTDTFDQLVFAVKELIERGGRAAPINATIANDSGPLDLAGFPLFDNTVVKSFSFFADIYRKTDSGVKKETGFWFVIWDSENAQWDVSFNTTNGDGGVVLSVAASGGPATEFKLQYTADDLAGGTYVGNMRITDLKFIRV